MGVPTPTRWILLPMLTFSMGTVRKNGKEYSQFGAIFHNNVRTTSYSHHVWRIHFIYEIYNNLSKNMKDDVVKVTPIYIQKILYSELI